MAGQHSRVAECYRARSHSYERTSSDGAERRPAIGQPGDCASDYSERTCLYRADRSEYAGGTGGSRTAADPRSPEEDQLDRGRSRGRCRTSWSEAVNAPVTHAETWNSHFPQRN